MWKYGNETPCYWGDFQLKLDDEIDSTSSAVDIDAA